MRGQAGEGVGTKAGVVGREVQGVASCAAEERKRSVNRYGGLTSAEGMGSGPPAAEGSTELE